MAEQEIRSNQLKSSNSPSMAVAAFVASFILEGLQRCTGVLFSGTLELSDETRRTAAVPFVVSRAVAYIASVLAKTCIQTRKPECWLLLGTLLCALGAALSFISNDDMWLTICWGVIFGTGIGMAFPETLKVSQKYHGQTLLTIFKSSAHCFSCILLPPLINIFISNFGISGCLLILSGIILNVLPFLMVAMYNIRFCLWKPNWRNRKKPETKNDTDNPKVESEGIDNKAFESDNCSEQHEQASVPNGKVPEDTKEQIPNGSADASHNQLNRKFSNINPNFQGLDEVIRKLGRDPTAVSESTHSTNDNNLFEKSFTEEDVLFDAASEVPRKISQSIDIPKSGSTVINLNNPNNPNRKRTLSVKYDIIDRRETEIDGDNATTSSEYLKQLNEVVINKNSIIAPNESDPPKIHTYNQNFLLTKPTPSPINSVKNSFPLEIKVHVVECTFTTDVLQKNKDMTNARNNGYRRHSNSLITSNYDNIDFNSPNFLKKYRKTSSHTRSLTNPSPRMYLISEDEEVSAENNSSFNRSNEILNESARQKTFKSNLFKSLIKIFKPTSLIIIYACVIYEITLITLLTVFDDLVTDAGIDYTKAVGVLAAFGFGGIAGRLGLRYWGDRLLIEGSHATAAMLFILDGVVVAGILLSPNLYWISGFYAALGFLEVSISTTVCNLVSDYIEEEIESKLFSTCTFFCGICILFVPYTIGLSRDDLGEYDGLLQITSGLSVLCALLCYILPRFANYPRHMRGS